MDDRFVLIVSVLLQYTAAVLAFRLIRVTGRRWAWGLIAAAVTLMAVRRTITCFWLITGDTERTPDLYAESVALVISALLVIGIGSISPFLIAAERSTRILKTTEDRYRRLVEAANVILWEADTSRRHFAYIGPQIERLLGFPAEAWYEEGFWVGRLHPDDRESALRFTQERTARGKNHEMEFRLVRADGGVVWCRDIVTVIRDDAAHTLVQGVLVDISARKSIEDALATRLRQQAAVARLGQAALAIVDVDELMNQAVHSVAENLQVEFCKVLELSPAQDALFLRAGVGWKDGLVGHAKVPSGQDSQAGFTLCSDEPVIVTDLRTEPRFSGPALLDDHNVVSGMSVIIPGRNGHWGVLGAHSTQERLFNEHDVNFLQAVANLLAEALALADAQETVRQSEARYRGVVEDQSEFIVRWKPDGTRTFANEAYCRAFGLDKNECIGTSFFPLIAEEDRHTVRKRIDALTPNRPSSIGTHRVLRADGLVGWQEWTDRGFFDERGKLIELQSVGRDVTERKVAEQRLLEEKAFSEMLINSSVDGILAFDRDCRYTLWNPAMERLSGVPKETCLGKCAFDVFPFLKEIGEDKHMLRALEGQASAVTDRPYTVADGRTGFFEGFYSPLRNERDEIVGGIALIRDVTGRKRAKEERKKLQEQLHQAQKLKAVGTLAAGVAHDVRNALTVIMGYADLAKIYRGDEAKLFEALDGITSAAEDAADVTRSLLTFSQEDSSEHSPIDLATEVRESIHMLRSILPAAIEIKTEVFSDSPVVISGNATQWRQVIVNLALNARDAMPDGGVLEISLRDSAHEDRKTGTGASGESAGTVTLVVKDSGTGMSEDVLARAMEPFFTTKPREQGTGLGLAVVHGIVTNHGGRIEIDSHPGRGTRITIELPGHEAAKPRTGSSTAPKVSVLGNGETVLLVEDNRQIRSIVAEALDSAGYNVLQAGDGQEGMELFEAHRASVRLLILDVDLPKMNGLAVLKSARKQAPSLAAIMISGSDGARLSEKMGDETTFLAKPFSIPKLLDAVGDRLGKSRE